MENFETLSVEQIFITEMARTALKSSHLSSLVNIKSAFLPVRSGLTKSGVTTLRATSGDRKNDPNTSDQR